MATALVVPTDLQSWSAQDKANYYGQQRTAGFSDPAIRNAISGSFGPQMEGDWNYALQLSGYQEPTANTAPKSNLPGNSLIAALRENTPKQPVGNVSSFTMLPNRFDNNQYQFGSGSPNFGTDNTGFARPPAPSPAPRPVAPAPAPMARPSPQQMASKINLTLPSGWDKLSTLQKVDYFNANDVTPDMLLQAGLTQKEIDALRNESYVGMSPKTQFSKIGRELPDQWNVPGGPLDEAQEKIAYFNKEVVSPSEMLTAGMSQRDLDWMFKNGYLVGAPTPAASPTPAAAPVAPAPAPVTQPSSVVTQPVTAAAPAPANSANTLAGQIPPDWNSLTPEKKIDWYSKSNLTPQQLRALGLSQADIDLLLRNNEMSSMNGMDDLLRIYEMQER